MGISGVIGENGRNFGGPERHLGIVGASTLKSGGPMGEIDLNGSSMGGWSCMELVAVRAVKELCGLVWSRTMWWCMVYSPPVRVYTFIGS